MSARKPPKVPKSQYMQVYVRCRPLSDTERQQRNVCVVDMQCPRTLAIPDRCNSKVMKTFTFDKVFSPTSLQADVYESVVEPLISDVLSGYNCTVFAYGQTGSGKTFTMEGDFESDKMFSRDSKVGVIPRAMVALFDELRVLQSEYTVRISLMELYNEELYDLLSPDDVPPKLRLFDDPAKKGSVLVPSLQEVMVHTQSQVLDELRKGSAKRQVAATLLNAQSSRSHTIFCVTVHTKENSMDGDQLLRTGKLYLVDLAGSENIGRSGSIDKRAREAASINQSLLALSRVTASIVDRQPHVPYRESKLTRILQDSFGGRTKTSMIATISPAHSNLEETLSTLEYAHRAKSVANKPEVNQKVSQNVVEKEYQDVIEDLRRRLDLSRNGSGVYVNYENYTQMINEQKEKNKIILDLIGRIRSILVEKRTLEETLSALSSRLHTQNQNLENVNKTISKTTEKIHVATEVLEKATNKQEEAKSLLGSLSEHEVQLQSHANQLIDITEFAKTDSDKIHDRLDQSRVVLKENSESLRKLQDVARLRLNSASKLNSSLCAGLIVLQKFTSVIEKMDANVKRDSKVLLESIQNFSGNFEETIKRIKSIVYPILKEKDAVAKKTSTDLQSYACKLIESIGLVENELHAACTAFYKVISHLSDKKTSCVDFIRESALKIGSSTHAGMNEFKEELKYSLNDLNSNVQIITDTLNNLLLSEETPHKKMMETVLTMSERNSAVRDLIIKNKEELSGLNCDDSKNIEEKNKEILLAQEQTSAADSRMDQQQNDLESYRYSVLDTVLQSGESFNDHLDAIAYDVPKTCDAARIIRLQTSEVWKEAHSSLYNISVDKTLKESKDVWSRSIKSLNSGLDLSNDLAKMSEELHQYGSEKFEGIKHTLKGYEDETMSTFIDGIQSSKSEFLELMESESASIGEVVSSEIKRDVPTGHTPVRKTYGLISSVPSLPSPVQRNVKSRIQKASWIRLLRSPRKPLSSSKGLHTTDDECMASDSEISVSKKCFEPYRLQKSSSLSDLRSNQTFQKPRVPKKFLRKAS